MAIELNDWLNSNPEAPGPHEAPEGWHKFFDSFTVCGEGECIKTLFTIYAPGKPRRGSVNFDQWERHQGWPVVYLIFAKLTTPSPLSTDRSNTVK
jgi:hypothetical protein